MPGPAEALGERAPNIARTNDRNFHPCHLHEASDGTDADLIPGLRSSRARYFGFRMRRLWIGLAALLLCACARTPTAGTPLANTPTAAASQTAAASAAGSCPSTTPARTE